RSHSVEGLLGEKLATTRSESRSERDASSVENECVVNASHQLYLTTFGANPSPVRGDAGERLPPLAMPSLLERSRKLEGLVHDQRGREQHQRADLVILQQDQPAIANVPEHSQRPGPARPTK